MLLLAMCAATALSLDQLLDDQLNRLARGDGLVLCLLFGVFLYYTAITLKQTKRDPFIEGAREVGGKMRMHALWIPAGLVLVGLVGLGIVENLLVDTAVGMAERLGMSQAAIGLTIVAIGTTVPELATSVLAALRGESDLAVGNVVLSALGMRTASP